MNETGTHAIRNGLSNQFRVDELWKNLGGYNKEKLNGIVEHYLLDELNYVLRHPNGKISLSDEGRKHCDEKFKLPDKIRK
jgi:hypothetical protein